MQSRRKSDISVDVYIPFVETLFRDGLTLTIGFVAQTLLVILVYWKTNEAPYLLVAAGFTGNW